VIVGHGGGMHSTEGLLVIVNFFVILLSDFIVSYKL